MRRAEGRGVRRERITGTEEYQTTKDMKRIVDETMRNECSEERERRQTRLIPSARRPEAKSEARASTSEYLSHWKGPRVPRAAVRTRNG